MAEILVWTLWPIFHGHDVELDPKDLREKYKFTFPNKLRFYLDFVFQTLKEVIIKFQIKSKLGRNVRNEKDMTHLITVLHLRISASLSDLDLLTDPFMEILLFCRLDPDPDPEDPNPCWPGLTLSKS